MSRNSTQVSEQSPKPDQLITYQKALLKQQTKTQLHHQTMRLHPKTNASSGKVYPNERETVG